jgi:hypothetical protein
MKNFLFAEYTHFFREKVSTTVSSIVNFTAVAVRSRRTFELLPSRKFTVLQTANTGGLLSTSSSVTRFPYVEKKRKFVIFCYFR